MPKGVKKIMFVPKPNGANNSNSKFGPDKWVIIPANKKAHFDVKEWHKDTTETQKKGSLYWMVLDKDRKEIIHRIHCMTDKYFTFVISRALCGYPYYIEASMSGKPDANFTGLVLLGSCDPLIISSIWSRTRGGSNIKNTGDNNYGLCYGEEVHFHADTEGINGEIVTVEVYNEMWNGDYKMRTLYNVEVTDGQINVKISNTSEWKNSIKQIQDNEEFYVKIKRKNGTYLKNKDGKDSHGKYLNIKNKLKVVNKTKPSNQTPLIIGESETNYKGIAPCRFSKIIIKDDTELTVFDEGKTKLSTTYTRAGEQTHYAFFDFNKSNIRSDAQKYLKDLASTLMVNKHSTIIIDGHADERGPGDYNLRLSQNRSEAVMNFLKSNGLGKSRFECHGHGENQLIYKGTNLTEEQHQKNRRAVIRLNVSEEKIPPIVFEVIAPSESAEKKKKLHIDVKDFEQKGCFGGSNKHEKKIKVIDSKGKEHNPPFTSPFDYEVYANLSAFNLFPMQYIWPKATTPNKYLFHIHSCRYYSNKKYPTVQVNAYPDIKWDFHFYLNLSNKLSVKWQNLPQDKDKKMKSEAGKIGAEMRWKQIEADWGVILEAKWDKVTEEKYNGHYNGTLKYKDKIKWLYKVFGSLKEFSKGVTGEVKGKVSATRLGKKIPLQIYMDPPNFCLGAKWYLERGKLAKSSIPVVGTSMFFYFKAEPLISLALNIDLLGALVQVGVAVATDGAGNKAANDIYYSVKEWLEDEDHPITLKMYIDLEITGTINGQADLEFNTESDTGKANAELSTQLKAELKAGIEVRGAIVILTAEAYVSAEASIKGVASVTFGHGLHYEQQSQKEKKLYYQPKLNFDGLRVTGILKAKVGLYIKKGLLKGDHSKNIVDKKLDATLFKPFDVIKKLEDVSGMSSKIIILE